MTISSAGPKATAFAESSKQVLSATGSETLHFSSPVVVGRAKGSRVTDVDGREFVDLVMGLGPLLLGHSPDCVVSAVHEAADRGMHHALPHADQERLARLVIDFVPCAERVLFCNSGTEATMFALRLARAFSGKDSIAVFEGSYHGAHDYVLTSTIQDSPVDAPQFMPRKGGIPASTQSTMMMLPYWNDAAFEMIERNKDRLAAVIIEPVQGGNPQSGHGAWLAELVAVCKRSGVLLILDEVITGFRLAAGGGQEWFNIVPDLATYGKVLGGGMPIGAVAGRADIMESFVDHHSESYPQFRETFNTGTFHGNPMSAAAGVALLTHVIENPNLYDDLNQRSERLTKSFNDFVASQGIPAHLLACGSIFLIHFGEQEPKTGRGLVSAGAQCGPSGTPLSEAARAFFSRVLRGGVIIPPAPHHFHLSTAHSDEDIDFVLAVMKESLLEVQSAGLW